MADENEKAVVSEDNDQLTDHFVGLPLGTLISQPIIEAARAQARLCEVYLDFLFKLAYEKEGSGSERKTSRRMFFFMSWLLMKFSVRNVLNSYIQS